MKDQLKRIGSGKILKKIIALDQRKRITNCALNSVEQDPPLGRQFQEHGRYGTLRVPNNDTGENVNHQQILNYPSVS